MIGEALTAAGCEAIVSPAGSVDGLTGVDAVIVPMPYAKHLEQAALPQPDKIVAAVKNLFGEPS